MSEFVGVVVWVVFGFCFLNPGAREVLDHPVHPTEMVFDDRQGFTARSALRKKKIS